MNTGASIRGKAISNPIPLDDDEFPIRTPGAGIATPLGNESAERQQLLQRAAAAIAARPDSHVRSERNTGSIRNNEITSKETSPVTPREPTENAPHTPVPAVEPRQVKVPVSLGSTPLASSGVPERKKSGLRSVFGRLFGKKRKSSSPSSPSIPERSNLRLGQHRSVSLQFYLSCSAKLP